MSERVAFDWRVYRAIAIAFLAIKLLDMLVINNLAMMTHMPNILRSLI